MTQQNDRPGTSTAPGPSDDSRTTTLRHEVLERGRRLVAARDPRTGVWRLYSVRRNGARPPTRGGGRDPGNRRESA